ncbi:hypothetical protein [Bradyrhizobium sp.]
MSEVLVRFFLGGLVVSAFALLGDILRPKSFAGLFGSIGMLAFALTFCLVVQRHAAVAFVAGFCAWAGRRVPRMAGLGWLRVDGNRPPRHHPGNHTNSSRGEN